MASYRHVGPVAVIEVNNPPVNALSHHVRQDLYKCIKKLADDAGVKAIVICGKVIETNEPGLLQLGRLIEDSTKPVVAAIQGVALGGGLEIALFCHYRVALKSARVGFPELHIGLIPGGEGTQRLPRLAGVPVTMDMIVTGRQVPAPEALKHGILDKIVDNNVVEEAVTFARSVINIPLDNRRLRNLSVKQTDNLNKVVDDFLVFAKRKYKGYIAPIACVEAVRAAVELSYDEGCEKERSLFAEMITSGQAQALMYAFFAERAAFKWALPSGENSTNTHPLPLKTTAVIGAGTMGSGIAVSLLTAGFPVLLLEQDKQFLAKGIQTISSILERGVRSKRLSEEKMKKCLLLLKPTDNFNQLKNVDLVIEAVYENLDLKKEIFSKLDKICKKETVLCTNTSTLDIEKIASATSRPEKVVGTHFFSPANIMRLLENIYGSKTSGTTVATVTNLAKTIGKVPVLVGTCYGFVANRTFFKYGAEAVFLVEEGALPHEVDQVLEDFGMPMGIFKTFDLSGLDVGMKIREETAKENGYTLTVDTRCMLGEKYSSLADQIFNLNRLGVKNGKGWYKYDKPGGRKAMVDDEVIETILNHSEKLGITRRKISSQEILDRCIFAVINEAFHSLEDGVAAKPEDIDIIWLFGFGFPRYRGGPLYYATQIGLRKVYERICYFYRLYPDVSHWFPSELLRRVALSDKPVPMSSWNMKATSKL